MQAQPGGSVILPTIAEQDIAGTAAEVLRDPVACKHAPCQLRGTLLVVDHDGFVRKREVGLDYATGLAERNACLLYTSPSPRD